MKAKIFLSIFLAGLFTFSACEDWLDVHSDSEIVGNIQFTNEGGFRDGLIGVYLKMAKDKLYGSNMTWRCVEILSQQYVRVSSMVDFDLFDYAYSNTMLKNYGKTIWQEQYAVIANINNILKHADINKGVMPPIMDSVVRGELLALRAYCHLDLMRLYGKGNYANRPDLETELTIPYSLDFSMLPPKQHTYKETFELLFKDIEDALKYLEADPLKSYEERPEGYYDQVNSGMNNFIYPYISHRRIRMNYYACLALYARALMWEGSAQSKAKALEVTKMVINQETITANTDWYSWITSSLVNTGTDYLDRDLTYINEHLWSLRVVDMLEYQLNAVSSGNWFRADSPTATYNVLFLSQTRAQDIFEISTDPLYASDWRYSRGLLPEGSSLSNYALVKFRERDVANNTKQKNASYAGRIPMLRISELFYIAAECLADTDPLEAMKYLNVVRNKRNIPSSLDLKNLNPSQIKVEIQKEYMKEFIGEGQLFPYYKRVGAEYIYGYAEKMTDRQYVFPLPDEELINGGRQQTQID